MDRLEKQGVDMSHMRISHAYEVLLGMEYYGKTKKGVNRVVHRQHPDRKDSNTSVGSVSAVDEVERHWGEEHERPRRLSRLMNDLHIGRRGSERRRE